MADKLWGLFNMERFSFDLKDYALTLKYCEAM